MSDTPRTDAVIYADMTFAVSAEFARRLERERNLALAIARKYYNGPELKNFPNVKI